MSADVLRIPRHDQPPPEAPPLVRREWPRMPYTARQRWLRRLAAANRPPDPDPAVKRPPAAPDGTEWTREQMLAARRAYEAYRTCGAPALTWDQQEAYRARSRGDGPKSTRPSPVMERVVAAILAAPDAAPGEIAASLGMTACAIHSRVRVAVERGLLPEAADGVWLAAYRASRRAT